MKKYCLAAALSMACLAPAAQADTLLGLYVGVEHYIPIDDDPKAVAEASGIITRSGCRRIAKFTFNYAIKTGRKKTLKVSNLKKNNSKK